MLVACKTRSVSSTLHGDDRASFEAGSVAAFLLPLALLPLVLEAPLLLLL